MHRTPLNDFHRRQGARLVEFAGWEMPLLYTGIVEEHRYTREHCTVFDVSHMGRIEFEGAQATDFLERLCTRRIADMQPGQCRYSHLCNESGGILDDVIVSRYPDRYLMVCNASNREKLLAWFERQRDGLEVVWHDRTFLTAMLAVQGPEALETLARLLPIPLGDVKRYHFRAGVLMGQPYFAARSGYTGEDGMEFIIPAEAGTLAAETLLERSADIGRPVRPAGLGARDTLRLEAGMPLYGHELTEEWDSITAGQAWCVDLTKDFIGRPVLERVKQLGPRRRLAGFELQGRRIARQGAPVLHEGRQVGVITSGTHSPTLDRSIAMGLIDATLSAPDTMVQIDVRGTPTAARVVALPFYRRSR